MRLNRYLALCGVASRRKSEEIIQSGMVTCDGEVVVDPAYGVLDSTLVAINDVELSLEKKMYVVVNKPRGYVSASSDKFYPTVLDVLPEDIRNSRLYPVGRLDRMSEGLLILTNDGNFCNELIHPSSGYDKTYEVRLYSKIAPEQLAEWRRGVSVEEHFIKPLSVDQYKGSDNAEWLRIVLREGIKREIRLMAAHFSLSVKVLFRRKIGKMELRTLNSGEYRTMKLDEIWEAIRHGGII